jgi:hypothetical protein
MSATRTSQRDSPASLGGVEGNERLTLQAGAVLFVLLGALGLTIVAIGALLWLHLFLGLVLVGPLALKLASTGYRFAGYYSGRRAYREKGPPAPALRILAPALVLDTVVVFASGIALLLVGPGSRGALLPVHKVSFIAWLVLAGLHVLGHLPAMARALQRPAARLPGARGRALALAAALVAGVVLAIALIPEFTPWMNFGG